LNDAHTSYAHFGTATDLPSLNQDNPETRAFLIQTAKDWIARTGIDGYRLDYALGVSHDFWKAFRAALKAEHPDFLLLGEVWTSGLKIAPYYDNEFDATFDFPVYFDLMGSHERAGNSGLLGKGSPSLFQSSLAAQERLYNPGAQSVRFLNNHDTLRAASQLPEPERQKLAATLLLTLPGTPMLYYGEEIGMRGDKSDGDRTVREPMDWYAAETGEGQTAWYKPDTRFNKAEDGISVAEQRGRGGSLLEHYRALVALRAAHDVLRGGDFVPLRLEGNAKAAAFLRVNEQETVLVLLNADRVPAMLKPDTAGLPATWNRVTNLLTGETLSPPAPPDDSFVVPPLEGWVLRIE
jgi:glycosidase